MWTLGRLTVRGRPSCMVVRYIDYAELLQQVQTAAAVDRAAAEQVSLATVTTLAERMSHDELVRLGARLPNQLQAAVRGGSPTCQPFGADEFVRRVAARIGVGVVDDAQLQARVGASGHAGRFIGLILRDHD